MIPGAGADPQQEEAETDSKDNSWFARAVTVQVYGSKVTPP